MRSAGLPRRRPSAPGPRRTRRSPARGAEAPLSREGFGRRQERPDPLPGKDGPECTSTWKLPSPISWSEDAPERRRITELLFEQIRGGDHSCVISDLCAEEIRATPDASRRDLLEEALFRAGATLVAIDAATLELAQAYIDAGAFTAPNLADALHVAAGTLAGCEAIVSWNFRHIVRAWTIQRVTLVNQQRGLGFVVICTPEEVLETDAD